MPKATRLPIIAIGVTLALSPLMAGADWLPQGTNVTSQPAEQERPAIVADGRGGAFVAWSSIGNGVWVQRLTAGGSSAPDWPAAAGLVPFPGGGGPDVANCRIVEDGAGGAFVVWDDERNAPNPGPDYGDRPKQIYLVRVTGHGTIAPGWPKGGLYSGSGQNAMTGTERSTDLNQVVVPDGTGGVIVAWKEAGVRAQRVSRDGRLLWGPRALAVCPSPGDQADPSLVADGEGGAFVAWEDLRDSTGGYRIFGQHLSAQGKRLWGDEGRRLTRGPTPHEQFQEIVSDGEGGLVLVWQAGASATVFDVFAQRISGTGEPVWAADAPVAQAQGAQQWPAAALDGSGGFWVTWVDTRSGTGADIYALRLTGQGRPAPGWPAGGAPVSTTRLPLRWRPSIVADGSGGAYIGWADVHDFVSNVAAVQNYGLAHVSREGHAAPGWPEGGFLLADPNKLAYGRLAMVADGRDGALMAWEQSDLTPAFIEEVLAQRALPAGLAFEAERRTRPAGAAAAVAAASPSFGLHGMVPNPGQRGSLVRFALPEAGPAALELYDLTGRKLWSRDVGDAGPGEHAVRIGDGARLPPGVYLVRLVQGRRVATARIVVVG